MGTDPSPVGVVLRQDDPRRHARRVPTTRTSDLRREAPLPIDSRQQLLDIDELRLELDHEEHPTPRMPREDVDRASLSIDRERDLGLVRPPAVPFEMPCELIVHLGVTRGEQPVELATPPARSDVQQDPKDAADRAKGRESDPVQLSTLDPRHHRLRDVGSTRDVGLGQARPDTNHPECATDAEVIHPARMTGRGYRPPILQFLATSRAGDSSPPFRPQDLAT